jgi:pyruvate dehydrogenase E2 component (dihydrolipoamide acetyltransferase)
MATAVELPQLGNTVEECLVTRWFKRAGDTVTAGEVVAEIETDKTTFEITAPVDGTVLARFVEEGAVVPVFTKLLVIGEEGESVEPETPASRPEPPREGAAAENAEPPERALAPAETQTTSVGVSPRARALAAERAVDVSALRGSGPGGRVIERDVRSAEPTAPPSSGAMPLSGTRLTIARRMRASLASTAQYTLHASANATALLATRARLKASEDTALVTINDLVMFCTVRALQQMPEVNVELVDGHLVPHAAVHLAFACDTPRGLVAPVVRDAHLLSLGALAARARTLAASAVAGTASTADLSGATFTVSNLGGLGIETFTPVLNPPQVAILGVGAITLRPVRRADTVTFVDTIALSLTCDHQVVDGAPGARFLQTLRTQIETVDQS